ncbi:ATP-grasp domain-containing protein [Pseudodesulfovibrio sp.]|uniref:ATP-grasp domain-containing protein n=1 Tax=unclassified Pseudodesulfovibrio TaxID=2661612 RepID=UPI003B00C514
MPPLPAAANGRYRAKEFIMLLNEHMSKPLFQQSDIPVPPGILIHGGEQANARPSFPLPWYLKAQVPAGGRGKAGGIFRVRPCGRVHSRRRHHIGAHLSRGIRFPCFGLNPPATLNENFTFLYPSPAPVVACC